MAKPAFVVSYEVHDEAVQRGLREQRRMIGQDIKRVAFRAAWAKVVPTAKVLAPSVVSRGIIARSTTRGATLSTSFRGMQRRIAGLLEYGGVVRTPILPVKGTALKFGGRYVANVKTPRKYRAGLKMTAAVHARAPAFQAQLDQEMTAIMKRRIQYARTF